MDTPERIELAGWGEVWAAAPPDLAGRHGIEAATIGGALCTAISEQASTMLNRVVGLGLDQAATDEDLDAIEAFFAHHRQEFYVSLHRKAKPADLSARLERRGFAAAYAWMKFTRGAEPPPEIDTELRVEVARPEHGSDFGDVVAAGYGLEPFVAAWLAELPTTSWHCYLAYDGDEPAGAAALYVHDATGYLCFAATRPEHRRKGAQGALLAARIRDAVEAGCTTLVTETGERIPMKPSDSYRNILRFGFEEAYLRPNYLSPEPTAARSTAAR
jgi:ribosomal protein S18 acetylase RimI-like enzyme